MHRSVGSLALLLVLATSVVLPRTAAAAWSTDPANPTPVTTAPGDQDHARVCGDGAGGCFVAWRDVSQAVVALVHFDSNGTPGVVRSLSNPAQHGVPFALTPDGSGGAILSWLGVDRVYAQRVSSSSAVLWPSGGSPATASALAASDPTAESDGAGGVYLAWAEDRTQTGDLDIYLQHLSSDGTRAAGWPADGLPVCTARRGQASPALCPDGAGGVIVAWSDPRNVDCTELCPPTDVDIYAQRVDANGGAHWAADGIAVTDAAGGQITPLLASDTQGGAYALWYDRRPGSLGIDLYAQRLDASGARLWPGDRAVCVAAGDQLSPRLVADGAGGAYAAWQDARDAATTGWDVYAQRLLPDGSMAWAANGQRLCGVNGDQTEVSLAADANRVLLASWSDARPGAGGGQDVYGARLLPDGTVRGAHPDTGQRLGIGPGAQYGSSVTTDGGGGLISAWVDSRSGTSADIYAARMDSTGYLTNTMTILPFDMPGDQGGAIGVYWVASSLDGSRPSIDGYRIYRSYPPSGPSASWQVYTVVPASGQGSYFVTQIPTPADRVGSFKPWVGLRVEAYQASSGLTWSSAVDSVCSTDDVAPYPPTGFRWSYDYADTVVHLAWDGDRAPDLLAYRLYMGGSPDFTPSPANRIAETPDTTFAARIDRGHWFAVSAVDVHQNESAATALGPTAVGDGVAGLRNGLDAPIPSPSRGAVALRFTTARAITARLVVFDVGGRRVRTLYAGALSAGEHRVRWDGADEHGTPAPAGVYLVRLELGAERYTRRLVLLH